MTDRSAAALFTSFVFSVVLAGCSSGTSDGAPDAASGSSSPSSSASDGADPSGGDAGAGDTADESDGGDAGPHPGEATDAQAPPPGDAGKSGGDAGPDSGTAPPPSSHLSAGCGKPAAATGVLHPAPLMIGGRARTWELTVPAKYVASEGHLFTTAFHGNTGTGDHIRETFKFENESGEAGIFAYPDGSTTGSAWHVEEDGDDLAFWDAILATVEADYCVDTSRIYMAGFSAGTYATNWFGCYRDSVVRAIASISGGFYNGYTGAYGPPASCPRKMPAYVAHGTADTTVPFQWGLDTRNFYAKLDACGSSTSPASIDPASCVSYDGCSSGTAVLWCTHPGAHVVTAFESADIWKFFSGLQ